MGSPEKPDMKFYTAVAKKPKLPKSLVQALGIDDTYITNVDPDNIWRHEDELHDSITFFLAKPKRGDWRAFTESSGTVHTDIPQYRAIKGLSRFELPYSQIFVGRTGRLGINTLVTFWDPRFTVNDLPKPEDQEILTTAIPILKAKGIVSRRARLWVFGYEGDLIQAPPVVKRGPRTKPEPWHNPSQGAKPQYSIEGRQYSYMDIARALHTLPRESREFQSIASFLRSTEAPELAGLKSRLPREQKPSSAYFKTFDLFRPENIESLGPQSRIDRYWDARVSSRALRLALRLIG